MRQLNRDYRLQGDSCQEVTMAYEKAILEMADAVRFRGKKLKGGPLLSGLVLWWSGLPVAERKKIARSGVEKLEAVLGEGSETPGEVTVLTQPLSKSKGGRKSG